MAKKIEDHTWRMMALATFQQNINRSDMWAYLKAYGNAKLPFRKKFDPHLTVAQVLREADMNAKVIVFTIFAEIEDFVHQGERFYVRRIKSRMQDNVTEFLIEQAVINGRSIDDDWLAWRSPA